VRCLFCGSEDPGTKVVDSREVDGAIRRRRECISCKQRFSTYERVERSGFMVIKKDSRREDFDRRKLFESVRSACYKRPISAEAIDATVAEVESELLGMGRAEVPSQLIGERVMTALRSLDEVAYVRFASVYREFRDVDNMVEEIEGLRQWKRRLMESRNQLRFRFEEDQLCWS
jgi:transcriptional repressor NrdR